MFIRPSTLSVVFHVATIYALGIMAGFFGTYSANVSLATLTFDGPLYATVQSALNKNVRHYLFFTFFFMPPLMAGVTLAAGWRARSAWGWMLLLAACLYAAGVIFFTREVNLPLNAYTESWHPHHLPGDWGVTREKWNAANAFRTAVSSIAFILALVGLALRTCHQAEPQARSSQH